MKKKKKEPTRPLCHPDRKHKAKGMCLKCYNSYQTKNSQNKKEITRRWFKENKQRVAELDRRYKFGIEPEEFAVLLAQQDSRCAICRIVISLDIKRNIFVDHDHTTGKTRSLLCRHCNTALGMFKENIATMQSAILYLNTRRYI